MTGKHKGFSRSVNIDFYIGSNESIWSLEELTIGLFFL